MKARLPLAVLAGLLALAAAPTAGAATYRIDDTGSFVSQPVTPMRWRQLAPGRSGDHTMEGRMSVALRLNLSSWVNRPARIYLSLAPTDGEQLMATWRTQGRLLPGTVRAVKGISLVNALSASDIVASFPDLVAVPLASRQWFDFLLITRAESRNNELTGRLLDALRSTAQARRQGVYAETIALL